MTLAKPIDPRNIHEYALKRSPESYRLFNVVALDRKGKVLVVLRADLEFDAGSEMVETLNASMNNCIQFDMITNVIN